MRNLTIIIIALLVTSSAYGFFGKKKELIILDRQLKNEVASNSELFSHIIYDRYVAGDGQPNFVTIGNWSRDNVISLLTSDAMNKEYYAIYPLQVGRLVVYFCSSDFANPFRANASHAFAIENGDYEEFCAELEGQQEETQVSSSSSPNGLAVSLLGNKVNEFCRGQKASHDVLTGFKSNYEKRQSPASYTSAPQRREKRQSRTSKVMGFLNTFFRVFRGLKRFQSPAPSNRLPLFVSIRR